MIQQYIFSSRLLTWSAPILTSEFFLVKINASSSVFLETRIFCFWHLNHGIIIRTGMTRKKIPCYMRDSACRWCIVKKAKILWIYVKHFLILPGVRNCRNLSGQCKQAFLNCPTIFLNRDNKTKLKPASFSCFLDFSWKKKYFLQSVTVLTFLISLFR